MLGDCYFMATLSACAEAPRRIKNRIKIQEVNDVGIYCVTLYVNGIETPVILDDYFPVCSDRPAFCSTKEGEIWGMLLEKAWAKLYGSYGRTSGGQTAFAAAHLVGLPTYSWNHGSEDDLKIGVDKFWK